MTRDIRLSFCIPVYNFGRFVTQTLDSITPSLARHADLEAVVLDGGSTDDTAEIMARYCVEHPSVRYVRQPNKGGIDRDMARSVELARGEYCWMLSGDDLIRPGAVEQLLGMLDGRTDVYLCEHSQCDVNMQWQSDYPIFDNRGSITVNLGDPAQRRPYLASGRNSEALFSFMSGLIIRREKWRSAPEPTDFMSSCWGHVARLLASASPDLIVRVVGQTWVDRRGDNDSFLAGGTVRRLAIAVNGYGRLAERFYGAGSPEAALIRGLIRGDIGIRNFVLARELCRRDPTREDSHALADLVRTLYADRRLDCLIPYAMYFWVPEPVMNAAIWTVTNLRRTAGRLGLSAIAGPAHMPKPPSRNP
ncbi:MAG: glycosyltransferase family 2 protein [Burkholderiales bacterium]